MVFRRFLGFTKGPLPLVSLSLSLSLHLTSQGAPLPVGDENYELVRRLTLRYGYDGFTRPATDPHLRPTDRGSLVRLVKTYDQLYGQEMSAVDRYRLRQFYADNNEWLALPDLADADDPDRAAYFLGDNFAVAATESPLYRRSDAPIFDLFYRTPAYLLQHEQEDFYLRFNPVLDVRYGRLADDAQDYFYNLRGVRLRAGIDDRFFLHFEIFDTQFGAPNYLRRYFRQVGGLPGAGLVKNELELEFANIDGGYNYLNGAGYLSVDITRHVGARLGYGQHFLGHGERSLLLSDFSNNYPFLELNWRIWKFHYRNIFAELTAEPQDVPNTGLTLEKKYLAAHYLDINIGERLTLGLYEAVVFSRDEGFELAYLNPIILYRTVEGSLGSPDNVLIGLTASYQLPSLRTEVYGQFVLDEFVYDELFVQRRGWWANKWAYQIGARHVDALGLSNLDLVIERNTARPYIYTHGGQSSYTHFAMPLAHPLGANFIENLVGFDYRPLPRLHLRGRAHLIEQGESGENGVVGENVNVSSDLRTKDEENFIGQGINYTNTLLQLRAGYELYPNLWIEADYLGRNKDSGAADRDLETTLVNLGVRWNMGRRDYAF